MIHVVDLGGATARVTAQLAGDDVVVLAFVCPDRDCARRLLGRIDGRLNRRRRDTRAAPPVAAAPADPFTRGAPVKVRTYEWDRGEMSVDAHVVRRLNDGRVEVRTRMGQTFARHERDLAPGWRAR